MFGAAVYPLGVVLAAAEIRSPALARCVPIATGFVLLLAGCMQQTAWKPRALAHCRDVPCGRSLPADGRTAWSHGVDLGVHCGRCCSGLMAAMLVTDAMDVRRMALINVFHLRGGVIFHFWGSELLYAPCDPGQDPRHVGTIEPVWNVLDLIPEGRGSWEEQFDYGCCHGEK